MEEKHGRDSFDKMYDEKEKMFGHPYREFQEYFNEYPKGSALDLGSGQGRDSIFLALLGYQVTAVDNSKIGIVQMLREAQAQKVEIDGLVADVLDYETEKQFDIILFDMLLHGFGKPKQLEILNKYSGLLARKGIMCIVFPDDLTTNHFMSMLKSVSGDWKLLDEIIVRDVPKMEGDDVDFTFTMIVVQST